MASLLRRSRRKCAAAIHSSELLRRVRPVLTGTLFKKSTFGLRKLRRWFVLKGGYLIYFAGAEDTEPRGVVRLHGAAVLVPDDVPAGDVPPAVADARHSADAALPKPAARRYSLTRALGLRRERAPPARGVLSAATTTAPCASPPPARGLSAAPVSAAEGGATLAAPATQAIAKHGQRSLYAFTVVPADRSSPLHLLATSAAQRQQWVTHLRLASRVMTRADFLPLGMLGEGGFARVMRVALRSTGERYAMKVVALKKRHHVKHAVEERAILEAAGSHPFVATLHFAFVQNGLLHFVQELAACDMYAYLRRLRRLPEQDVRFYVAELVLALHFLHSMSIIHRDLKLENVLLARDGHVMLTDFGLATQLPSPAARSHSNVGTEQYQPPEMIQGTLGHGRGADWWQLGCFMYELLTGVPPFASRDKARRRQKILTHQVAFPRGLRVSDEARDLVEALLRKHCWDRLGSGPDDGEEVMQHPFFAGLDWDAVRHRQLQPPYVPSLEDCVGSEGGSDTQAAVAAAAAATAATHATASLAVPKPAAPMPTSGNCPGAAVAAASVQTALAGTALLPGAGLSLPPATVGATAASPASSTAARLAAASTVPSTATTVSSAATVLLPGNAKHPTAAVRTQAQLRANSNVRGTRPQSKSGGDIASVQLSPDSVHVHAHGGATTPRRSASPHPQCGRAPDAGSAAVSSDGAPCTTAEACDAAAAAPVDQDDWAALQLPGASDRQSMQLVRQEWVATLHGFDFRSPTLLQQPERFLL